MTAAPFQDPPAVTTHCAVYKSGSVCSAQASPVEHCQRCSRPFMISASPALCNFQDYCFATSRRGRSIVGLCMMKCRGIPTRRHGASPSFQLAAAHLLTVGRGSRIPRNSTHATARRTLQKESATPSAAAPARTFLSASILRRSNRNSAVDHPHLRWVTRRAPMISRPKLVAQQRRYGGTPLFCRRSLCAVKCYPTASAPLRRAR